jgi:hypothetical protein
MKRQDAAAKRLAVRYCNVSDSEIDMLFSEFNAIVTEVVDCPNALCELMMLVV